MGVSCFKSRCRAGSVSGVAPGAAAGVFGRRTHPRAGRPPDRTRSLAGRGVLRVDSTPERGAWRVCCPSRRCGALGPSALAGGRPCLREPRTLASVVDLEFCGVRMTAQTAMLADWLPTRRESISPFPHIYTHTHAHTYMHKHKHDSNFIHPSNSAVPGFLARRRCARRPQRAVRGLVARAGGGHGAARELVGGRGDGGPALLCRAGGRRRRRLSSRAGRQPSGLGRAAAHRARRLAAGRRRWGRGGTSPACLPARFPARSLAHSRGFRGAGTQSKPGPAPRARARTAELHRNPSRHSRETPQPVPAGSEVVEQPGRGSQRRTRAGSAAAAIEAAAQSTASMSAWELRRRDEMSTRGPDAQVCGREGVEGKGRGLAPCSAGAREGGRGGRWRGEWWCQQHPVPCRQQPPNSAMFTHVGTGAARTPASHRPAAWARD